MRIYENHENETRGSEAHRRSHQEPQCEAQIHVLKRLATRTGSHNRVSTFSPLKSPCDIECLHVTWVSRPNSTRSSRHVASPMLTVFPPRVTKNGAMSPLCLFLSMSFLVSPLCHLCVTLECCALKGSNSAFSNFAI